MTELKKNILALLKEDARFTPTSIAVMLGKDEKEIVEAIEELENSGIIAKYTAVVNTEKTGEDYVDALIEVKVTPQARSGFDSIADEICKFPEVKAVYLMSGTFDLAIMLESKTMRDISLFVSERLARIESVVSTATHFIMKQYKEGGVMLYDGENPFRMPIHE